jgi:hypothetical protein
MGRGRIAAQPREKLPAVRAVDQDVHGNETRSLCCDDTDKSGKACEVPNASAHHSIDSRPGEADCEAYLGRMLQWFALGRDKDTNPLWVPPHEAGHLLGLTDEYWGGGPAEGWEHDIMGQLGQLPSARDISEIIYLNKGN